MIAYIGLGSNLGDRENNLRQAVHALRKTPGVTVRRVAPLYRAAPVGVTDQPEFLNTVVEVTTVLSPRELLSCLLETERALGRVRGGRWGPRVIDLDLLLYDAVAINTPDLVLPHPRLTERAFVVVPLSDLVPELSLPGDVTVTALADKLRKEQFVERVTEGDRAE
uniref:2-amino-4-hydroxy-6-hydroxymethyldihydropteridine diphosphokinase n=1 Tax=Ammonifex degensii TaxID=42838 RepID=A0A7C2EK41_9THEO